MVQPRRCATFDDYHGEPLTATSSSWSPPIPLASWVLWFVLESSITVSAGSRPSPAVKLQTRPCRYL
jgi:hypothetical protein